MYRYCGLLFSDGNAEALEDSLKSLAAINGFAENGRVALIFNGKKYEILPQSIKAVADLCDASAINISVHFSGDDGCLSGSDDEILFFLREGDKVSPFYTLYLDSFFAENDCPVYIPVRESADNGLPRNFADLPLGGVSMPNDDLPQTVRGAAVFARDVKAAGGSEADFTEALARAVVAKNAYGRINRIALSGGMRTRKPRVDMPTRQEYLVSCIVPIYNVEKYLEEALDSVIAQSIGFEENVQLILVNDGSPDGCAEICRDYRARFPENVVYIEQENQGVSAARNAGLDVATGEYVAFLDGDDRLNYGFFSECVSMLNMNVECAFVGVGVFRIGDAQGLETRFRRLEYRQSGVMNDASRYVFTNVCAGVFRRAETLSLRFSEDELFSAELEFLCSIVLVKQICYCATSVYNSRSGDTQTTPDAIIDFLHRLFAESGNAVSPYLQSLAIELISEASVDADIDNIEAELRTHKLEYILIHMSDECFEREFVHPLLRIKLYELKYHGLYIDYPSNVPSLVYYDKEEVMEIAQLSQLLVVNQIFEKDGVLHITALTRCTFVSRHELVVASDSDVLITEISDYVNRRKVGLLGCELYPLKYYEIEIKLSDFGEISFFEIYEDYDAVQHRLSKDLWFGNSSSLCFNNTFFFGDSYCVSKTAQKNKLSYEPLTMSVLSATPQRQQAYTAPEKKNTHSVDSDFVYLSKLIVSNYSIFAKRRIWLFMDRHMEVENNAEALFRYCAEVDDGIEKWFVIPYASYTCRYRGRNTVVFGSMQFRVLLTQAEKFISSFLFAEGISLSFGIESADNEEGFAKVQNFRQIARQFFRGDIVHLQHGVVFGDISTYLNKNHERFSLITSVGEREYAYIQTLSHSIPSDRVKMTGLPKYDLLEALRCSRKKGGYVLFAPSFDRNAAAKDRYMPQYKISAQFKFINAFLNSEQLAEILRKSNYRLLFKPHYLMNNNLIDFDFPDYVDVVTAWDSKYDLFEKSDLLITDYSGIAFEFAYLEKPLLYAHISENTKFDETYWMYEENGFGEICHSIDELIGKIIEYIDDGCVMPDIYKERVDDFFTYRDGNNCERVYNEIMKLPDTRKKFI